MTKHLRVLERAARRHGDGRPYLQHAQDRWAPVGGMIVLPPEAESMPVMWMGYVTVESLEASLAKATELGAEHVPVPFPLQ